MRGSEIEATGDCSAFLFFLFSGIQRVYVECDHNCLSIGFISDIARRFNFIASGQGATFCTAPPPFRLQSFSSNWANLATPIAQTGRGPMEHIWKGCVAPDFEGVIAVGS